ncbi:MAG: hypothetical protein FJ297_03625 [Planctomycetes bacterium]|nr:hypothetical protein [Planctomycetota bacterium]
MGASRYDVAIIGSGFGGSLLAMVLTRLGKRVVLVERTCHPRFAIGESSTPIADMILADLASRYDLPRIAPLAQYGSWRRTYPGIERGRKRGFSYFRHEPGRAFQASPEHGNELLVAASGDDDRCDTHWLRADVDQFLAREAVELGTVLHERTTVEACDAGIRWGLRLRDPARSWDIESDLLIDASGSGGFGRRWLDAGDDTPSMRAYSRSIYTHFDDVGRWADVLASRGARLDDHPFPCDDAALHHIFDDAWMWMLPFDCGRVSVGLALGRKHDTLAIHDPDAVWRAWLDRYPSLADQLGAARLAPIPGRWIVEDRLQRRCERAAGPGWASLPFAYGFIDPMHSMGIAFTLSAIERLAIAIDRHGIGSSLDPELLAYERAIRAEFDMADRLIHAVYATMGSFPLFVLAAMLYFTAVVTYEQRRKAGRHDSFLCANDPELRPVLERLYATLLDASTRLDDEPSIEDARRAFREAIAPFNSVGLCDDNARNMYHHTIAR